MSNNIRACFCVLEPLHEVQLQVLLDHLKVFGIVPIGEPTYNEGFWIEQKLIWTFANENWEASLIQIYFGVKSYSTFSFDLNADVFLPKGRIAYSPNGDPKFNLYKKILVQIIKLTMPKIGEIDYEADLICSLLDDKYPNRIASWGNYFPSYWVNNLSEEARKRLLNIVEDVIPIDNLGYVTFIHPIEANRAWNIRHIELEGIIRENMSFDT